MGYDWICLDWIGLDRSRLDWFGLDRLWILLNVTEIVLRLK